jgi:threonyl-tRNA synthetase
MKVDERPAAAPPSDEGHEHDFEVPARGSAEELLDAEAGDPLDPMRHSAAHVMAEAVMDLFPGTKLGIGPAIEGGFYYDFDLPRPLTPDDLERIEARMAASIAADRPFVRRELPPDEGRAFFVERDQPYKVEILDDLRMAARSTGTPDPGVSTFEHGGFVDLCRGPHVESTGRIGPFKLLTVAGAYWRGREDRPMLQRVYGTVWATQEELDLYLWRREEARKRDHRRLGVQLDLFHFDERAPGSAIWHPKGAQLWNALESLRRSENAKRGYLEVKTPLLYDTRLWEQTGHWEKYRELLFLIPEEERKFGLKPMNCPGHMLVFGSRVRSYRDLPFRLAESGTLHRNEPAGTLHGLLRLYTFHQDDAHVFCTEEQIHPEIDSMIEYVRYLYDLFGVEGRAELSTRPENRLGTDAQWDVAEGALETALKRHGIAYSVAVGEGVFYGPKIDLHMTDSGGRSWQMGTIQIDYQLPSRLDLTYSGADNHEHTPVMIHRALFGSIERFLGILIEHYGGAFPFWLAPVQVRVLPVGEAHQEPARSLRERIEGAGYRVDVDERAETVGKRIRDAELEKVPKVIVYGDRESEEALAVRDRGGGQSTASLEDLLADLATL